MFSPCAMDFRFVFDVAKNLISANITGPPLFNIRGQINRRNSSNLFRTQAFNLTGTISTPPTFVNTGMRGITFRRGAQRKRGQRRRTRRATAGRINDRVDGRGDRTRHRTGGAHTAMTRRRTRARLRSVRTEGLRPQTANRSDRSDGRSRDRRARTPSGHGRDRGQSNTGDSTGNARADRRSRPDQGVHGGGTRGRSRTEAKQTTNPPRRTLNHGRSRRGEGVHRGGAGRGGSPLGRRAARAHRRGRRPNRRKPRGTRGNTTNSAREINHNIRSFAKPTVRDGTGRGRHQGSVMFGSEKKANGVATGTTTGKTSAELGCNHVSSVRVPILIPNHHWATKFLTGRLDGAAISPTGGLGCVIEPSIKSRLSCKKLRIPT